MIDAYNFVHLALLAAGGEVKGRTMLQKKVYFMGILCECLDDLGYEPHFYGPFSAEVEGAVDRLRGLGFADQTITNWGFDHKGFERNRYDLKLNKDGRDVAEDKKRNFPELWKKLIHAEGILKSLGRVDYMGLSFAAKTYFMALRKGRPVTPDELCEYAKNFAWKVSNQQISEAIKLLEKMHLAKPAAKPPCERCVATDPDLPKYPAEVRDVLRSVLKLKQQKTASIEEDDILEA
jgi:uncharacterized protein YwgA